MSIDLITQYFHKHDHCGQWPQDTASVYTGIGTLPSRGCTIQLQTMCDGEHITDAKFKAQGCPSTIATAAYLTESIIGKSLEDMKQITRMDIVAALGLPKLKYHCAMVAEEALKQIVRCIHE